MTECCRCGECCRWIIFPCKHGTFEWEAYYIARGCKTVYDKETHRPVGIAVPSPCPHLKIVDLDFLKSKDGDRPGKGFPGKGFFCDIYHKRPALCRLDNKTNRFYRPEGCTDLP